MIILVPADTPVTNPLLLTVAIPVLADDQLPPTVGADPVNCVVKPTQTVNVPVIVGKEFTVTVSVIAQPLPLG